MTGIHIPPAALEAGARAAHNQWRHECAVEADEPVENWREWDELDEWEQDSFRAQARAAFVAMVEAWPNGNLHVPVGAGQPRKSFTLPALILPLPQETRDDE